MDSWRIPCQGWKSSIVIYITIESNSNKRKKIDTTPLITHRFPLAKIAEAYELFEQKRDGVIKVAITQ